MRVKFLYFSKAADSFAGPPEEFMAPAVHEFKMRVSLEDLINGFIDGYRASLSALSDDANKAVGDIFRMQTQELLGPEAGIAEDYKNIEIML